MNWTEAILALAGPFFLSWALQWPIEGDLTAKIGFGLIAVWVVVSCLQRIASR